jgi:hypothetical protein
MSDSQQLEDAVRDLIIDLCAVLQQHGYRQISMGHLMRVIGVDPQQANRHDSDMIDLLDASLSPSKIPSSMSVPPGTTIH